MRNHLIAWTLLMSVFALFTTACSNRVETADEEAAQSIPDLSGIWEAPIDVPPGGKPVSDVCGEPACANLLKQLGEPPLAHAVTVDEPQMLPWAEEKYKAAREGLPEAVPVGREEKHPYFSGCATLGPSALTLAFFNAVEVRQFPDAVFLFFGGIAGEADHAVRRIYLDGREHPPDLRPTWMGHSTGSYEGDTLVVDTVGISSFNDSRWIDLLGYPHSDALRLVERFRRVDDTLEYEVTIHDPKAYKNSWSKKIVRALAAPGPRLWDDSICEELLQMGTHYGAEAKQ